jgi:hypothetical protein
MSILHLRLGLQLKLLKSPMGYIEMNLNMGITFKVKYSYNFALRTHVLIFTNYIYIDIALFYICLSLKKIYPKCT